MQVPAKAASPPPSFGRQREQLHTSSSSLHKDHVWSYDFVSDRTEDGRRLKLLAVIDEYTRECLAIEVSRSFTAEDVVGILQYLFAVRGAPQHIRSDNGPEFVAKTFVAGSSKPMCRRCSSPKAAPGRTATSNRSMASYVTNC